MSGFSKLIVLGNVGSEPAMRYVPSGTPVTSFSLAVDRAYTVGGEKKEETVWLSVSAWGRLAEVANNYLNKGARCLVEGYLRPNKWTDEAGVEHDQVGVTAEHIQFL
jgi:single-strand DNA-binding protein